MRWKNLQGWLKGGIIGLIISVIYMLLTLILEALTIFPEICIYCSSAECAIPFWCCILFPFITYWGLIGVLTNLLSWFMIGGIIGFIISKFKSKKRTR